MRDSERISVTTVSPERGRYNSPRQMNLGGQAGQRPGNRIAVIFEALKGRNMNITIPVYFAPSGLQNPRWFYNTGRCPVLKYNALSGH